MAYTLFAYDYIFTYINSWFICSKQNGIPWIKQIDIETIICCIQRVDYIYRDIISITDLSQGKGKNWK